jgi:hypothetical protein
VTSVLVDRKHIWWKPTSPYKSWKLQSGTHDVDPKGPDVNLLLVLVW